ncbi:MAG: rod shape-determining protein MreC, partial [Elusimicrobia bacterium]|nr:rod shape-determining protein MreC [Elusimicrobiota bacterium]
IANTLLLIFSTIALLLLFMPLSTPVQCFKAGVSYILNPVPFRGSKAVERFAGMPATIIHLISADIENRDLRAENRNFALIKAELDSVKAENDRLRGQMGLKPPPGRLLLWARVMEREPLNWNRFVMVDVGEKDGVEINSPVLGVQGQSLGAVGRVTEVGPTWSKVLLLTDEQSAAAAYISGLTWEGLVEGQGGAKLKMSYLPAEAQFAIGQLVKTSATSATFPPDVLIGSISKVYARDPFLTFQSVEVAPAVQAGLLKEVLIVVRQKAGDS